MATWRKPLAAANVRQPATVGHRAVTMRQVKSLGLNIPRDVPNLLEQIYTGKQNRQRVQKVGTVLIHRVGESSTDTSRPLEYTASFETSHPAYTCLLPTTSETNDYEHLLPSTDVQQESTTPLKLLTDNGTVSQDNQETKDSGEKENDVEDHDDKIEEVTTQDTEESLQTIPKDARDSESGEDMSLSKSISLSPDKYDPAGPEEIILHEESDAVEEAFLAKTVTEQRKSDEKALADVSASLVEGEKDIQADSKPFSIVKTPSRKGPPPPRPPRKDSQKRVHFATVTTVGEEVSQDKTTESPRRESTGQGQERRAENTGGLERSASNVSYIDITGMRKDSRPLIFV